MVRRYMDINFKIKDLIYPYFVAGGKGKRLRIRGFPGVFRFSADTLLEDLRQTYDLGIDKILLFATGEGKDEAASNAYKEGNLIAAVVEHIKTHLPRVTVITDVCLCAYTSHGHCGILNKNKDGTGIDNDLTLETLSRIALSHAKAGTDWVAPSAMAKGQVGRIKQVLVENGYRQTKIMGYSAKFNSNFYGPFRNAAGSAPKFGDRSAYQLDSADTGKALKEMEDDITEGADAVMVKPALSYLDIVRQAKDNFDVPLAVYNTSGEYSMIKYAARFGILDEKKALSEIMTSVKRAGADLVITYHAKEIAKWIR